MVATVDVVLPLMVLALLAFYAVFFIVRTPWVGLAVIVLLLPFNGLITQLYPSFGDFYGPLKDALLALTVLAAGLHGRLRSVPRLVQGLVLLYLAVGLLAVIRTPVLEQGLYGWRNDFYPLLLLIAAPAVLTPRAARTIANLAVGVAQIAAVVTLTTWRQGVEWMYTVNILPVGASETFPFQYFLTGSQAPRGFSPYNSPNEAGLAYAIVVAVICTTPGWSTRKRLLLAALPVAATLSTQSRSAILGLLVLGLALMANQARLNSKGVAPIVLPLVGAAMAVAAAVVIGAESTAQDLSFGGHADSLTAAPGLIQENPFGAGAGRVGPRALLYEESPVLVESFFLVLALEASLLALVVYLLINWRVVKASLAARSTAAFMAPAALAASLVSQLVLPTLQDAPVSMLLWIVVAIGLHHAGVRPDLEPPQVRSDHVGRQLRGSRGTARS
ncbi:hypothetical protein [Nocardioides dongkuii]|uniref:hypothetical protein n=1 Tax=Nocardioides dongkuii TaxID=2760089 RepID=UPI0018780FC2|nr:hypothetical protein [Nocardioides dongkuii]